MKEPPRVPLARLPTPVEPLDRLSARWGGPRIWVKRDDLTGLELSGNKVRKLEYCLGEALALGASRVMTCGGVQSNHCRATALACARLGLTCTLFLRAEREPDEVDGNHLLDRIAGADVEFVTPEAYGKLGPTRDAYWIPEGASDETGLWGYRRACAEIDRRFVALVHAVGSGGTTAGLIAGKLDTPLVGICVCDDAEYFYEKIESILRAASMRWPALDLPPARESVEILDGFVGRGYAKSRSEEWALLREVAQTEGLLLDPVYTVKAMLGLRQCIRDGRFRKGQDVLFLHTGGVFGLFPKRQEALSSS